MENLRKLQGSGEIKLKVRNDLGITKRRGKGIPSSENRIQEGTGVGSSRLFWNPDNWTLGRSPTLFPQVSAIDN